jgi:hypothetical protein
MKKFYLFITIFIASITLNAQTNGSLTFSVTTTSTGNYSPKHVVAIWIEKNDGTFVKTKLKRAATRVQWLNQWVSKSAQNVIDATTSATISSHQTETITWNATDVNGTLVPDGDYKVWIQMAWANSNGPTYSIPFTKGISPVNLAPANQTNYTNMSLIWTPNTIGISENSPKNIFTICPNPVTAQSNLNYSLNDFSDVTINMYDITGKLVRVLFDGNQNAGNYSLPISLNGKVKHGIYFIKFYTGKNQYTENVLILE